MAAHPQSPCREWYQPRADVTTTTPLQSRSIGTSESVHMENQHRTLITTWNNEDRRRRLACRGAARCALVELFDYGESFGFFNCKSDKVVTRRLHARSS